MELQISKIVLRIVANINMLQNIGIGLEGIGQSGGANFTDVAMTEKTRRIVIYTTVNGD